MGWSTICWHPLCWLLASGHCTFWLLPHIPGQYSLLPPRGRGGHFPTGCGTWWHPLGWSGKGKDHGLPPPPKSGRSPGGCKSRCPALLANVPRPGTRWGCLGNMAMCRYTARAASQPASPQGCTSPLLPPPHHLSTGGNPPLLLEFASAGEVSILAKPDTSHSTIAFPNSTFFAFWVPLTLPEAFPEQRGIHFCKVDLLPGELNMFIFSQHVTVSILPVKHPFTVCLV